MMSKRKLKKWVVPLLVMTALISVASLVTLAWITSQTNSIENKLKLATLKTELIEEVDNMESMSYKDNVRVKNIGEAMVYIRIKMVIEILDQENIIANPIFYDETGKMIDVELSVEDLMDITGLNVEDWFVKDGYYYYKKSLSENEETSILFERMVPKKSIYLYDPTNENTNNSLTLSLSVLSEAIQVNAVDDVWDVEVDQAGFLTYGGGTR